MNKIIRKIENSLQTDDGQRFLQYAYSFGAAIVIFGAMVKVLHWWGIWGNIIFGTGMAIECIVFILYGLDRPSKEYRAEQTTPAFESEKTSVAPRFAAPPDLQEIPHRGNRSSKPVLVDSGDNVEQLESVSDNVAKFTQEYVQQMEALNRNISGLNTIYEIQLKSISGQLDTIAQINNGLTRIKSMYNDTIPDSSVIRQETEKMTEQLRALNQIYGRMIQAMTNPQHTE